VKPLETAAAVARGAWEMVPADDATLEVTAERSVGADESRLQRLFQNLFSNAVTHNEEVVIEVGDLEDGFYVADMGEEIDDGLCDRVFESGYTTGNGTGLGLVIVEEITEAHGWSYTLADSGTGGARFEFIGVSRP
jgi:signal transduction histidine kinase